MATGPEIAPAAFPAACSAATLIAEVTASAGTPADAEWERAAASHPPDAASPRRASRLASSPLALARPLATVPSGQPSRRAASLRVWPSRSHRTTNARSRSGSRANSSSSRNSSSSSRASATAGSGSTPIRTSRRLLLAAAALTRTAVCRATPWSQFTTISLGTTVVAFWANTRNVAWKASSASCGSRRTGRHTPHTIGACRDTRAARASASRRPRKSVSSPRRSARPRPARRRHRVAGRTRSTDSAASTGPLASTSHGNHSPTAGD